MKRIIKFINGYEGKYGVDEQGNVYSYCIMGSRSGRTVKEPVRILKPHTGKNSDYLLVGLSNNDETVSNKLVHRLVAETFLPNPENLPEIDHIDDNPKNNCVENLQWVSREQNMAKVFSHSSPVRNYRITQLIYQNVDIGYFISQQAAVKYAQKQGASATSLVKYKQSRGWILESVSTIPEGSSIWDENGCEVVPEFGYKN